MENRGSQEAWDQGSPEEEGLNSAGRKDPSSARTEGRKSG